MRYDITKLTLAADTLLPTLTDPRHIAIITNYRRHAIFEVTGHYARILAPDMCVDVPDYWLHSGGASVHIRGHADVTAIYASLVRAEICVMMLENERLWVDEWGFSSMATFHTFMPGTWAINKGAEVDDLDAIYIQTTEQSMQWPYDEHGRMIGERVWIGAPTFRKCPPEQVITREEAEARLMPLLDDWAYPVLGQSKAAAKITEPA